MIHVREITDFLVYTSLVKDKEIPDLLSLLPTVANKRYPPFVYKSKNFSWFGYFMDIVVRGLLANNLDQTVINRDESESSHFSANVNKIVDSVYQDLDGENSGFDLQDIRKYVPTLVNIGKELTAKWLQYSFLSGTIIYNEEYCHEHLFGHPDIVTDNTILDIKTTATFNKMAPSSLLQIMAYLCLARVNNINITHIGLVLPIQRDIIVFDVAKLPLNKYWALLQKKTNQLSNITLYDMDTIKAELFSRELSDVGPGRHISPKGDITKALTEWYNQYGDSPCQIFTGPPQRYNVKISDEDLVQIHEVISSRNMNVFIHAPYIINLSSDSINDIGTSPGINRLIKELQYGVAMGAKGVIVHTGARVELSEKQAYDNMYRSVLKALAHATEECPLLLETPCGEGTEIVSLIEDFIGFCEVFTDEEKAKLAVCVDTCHVFAAGYDPLMYLHHWNLTSSVPIKLIHYNDSQTSQGSHVDRHAPPGLGYVGLEMMVAIRMWANEHNIPMVIE